jgi:arsenite methyltransferase
MTKNNLHPSLTYDELPLWSAPFGLAILDTIHLKQGMNILDVGSGSGFPMLEIADRAGASSMVYGIDPSDDAILMINQKIEAKEIKNAKIVKGFAEQLPFEDNYFDLIVSNNGINNVPDQEKVLSECFRVAKPGAQMVVTVNLPGTMIEFYEVFEKVLQNHEMQEEIRKMKDHIFEKRKPFEFINGLFEKAGFSVGNIKLESFKYRYIDASAFFNHYLIRNYFLPSWLNIVPPVSQKMIFDEIEEQLNGIAREKGEFVITIPFVCIDGKRSITAKTQGR